MRSGHRSTDMPLLTELGNDASYPFMQRPPLWFGRRVSPTPAPSINTTHPALSPKEEKENPTAVTMFPLTCQ